MKNNSSSNSTNIRENLAACTGGTSYNSSGAPIWTAADGTTTGGSWSTKPCANAEKMMKLYKGSTKPGFKNGWANDWNPTIFCQIPAQCFAQAAEAYAVKNPPPACLGMEMAKNKGGITNPLLPLTQATGTATPIPTAPKSISSCKKGAAQCCPKHLENETQGTQCHNEEVAKAQIAAQLKASLAETKANETVKETDAVGQIIVGVATAPMGGIGAVMMGGGSALADVGEKPKQKAITSQSIKNVLGISMSTTDMTNVTNTCNQSTDLVQSNIIAGSSVECSKNLLAFAKLGLLSSADLKDILMGSKITGIKQTNAETIKLQCQMKGVAAAASKQAASIGNTALQKALSKMKTEEGNQSADTSQNTCNDINVNQSACNITTINNCCSQVANVTQTNQIGGIDGKCLPSTISGVVQSNTADITQSCIINAQAKTNSDQTAHIKNKTGQTSTIAQSQTMPSMFGGPFMFIAIIIIVCIIAIVMIIRMVFKKASPAGALGMKFNGHSYKVESSSHPDWMLVAIGGIAAIAGGIGIVFHESAKKKGAARTNLNKPFLDCKGVQYLKSNTKLGATGKETIASQERLSYGGALEKCNSKENNACMGFDFFPDDCSNVVKPVSAKTTGTVSFLTKLPASDRPGCSGGCSGGCDGDETFENSVAIRENASAPATPTPTSCPTGTCGCQGTISYAKAVSTGFAAKGVFIAAICIIALGVICAIVGFIIKVPVQSTGGDDYGGRGRGDDYGGGGRGSGDDYGGGGGYGGGGYGGY